MAARLSKPAGDAIDVQPAFAEELGAQLQRIVAAHVTHLSVEMVDQRRQIRLGKREGGLGGGPAASRPARLLQRPQGGRTANVWNAHTTLMTTFPVARPDSE